MPVKVNSIGPLLLAVTLAIRPAKAKRQTLETLWTVTRADTMSAADFEGLSILDRVGHSLIVRCQSDNDDGKH